MAQTKPKAAQFYGVSDNGTDGQFLKTDGTGGMSWDSPITNPTITSIDYPGSATAADPAGGESVIINGTLFASGITCTVGGTSAVTAFNSATQITITTPAKAAGQYTVAVTNPDGGTASQANFIQYSGVPVWSTAAGSLGSVQDGATASFQVTATEGSDTIEYAVTTGSLPTGLSLATATGAITGTAGSVSASTTTTFSITATDDENQTSSARSFNITVTPDLPSNHFTPIIWTGDGSSNRLISTVNFQSDFIWAKQRNGTGDHILVDSVRGGTGTGPSATNLNILYPYGNFTESTNVGSNYIPSIENNGFRIGTSSYVNTSGNTYVAWCLKAGGAAVANTAGGVTSQVSVNNTLGFSIVDYTAPGGTAIGHGLNGAPDLIILKGVNAAEDWLIYNSISGTGNYLSFSRNGGGDPVTARSSSFSSVTATTFTDQWTSGSLNWIAYCLKSQPGFSKVGSYTGNTTNPPIVSTGFEPAFLIIKAMSKNDSWFMVDNKRETSNPRGDRLFANSTAAETSEPGAQVNFLSNGFQITGSGSGAGQTNSNGETYLYIVFAADPSTTTPSLANSFATDLYTGSNSSQSVSIGFAADLVFTKSRNGANNWGVFDSVRGPGQWLQSNTNDRSYPGTYGVEEFNSNNIKLYGGFTPSNYAGQNYVSYSWKAGGTPSINIDGTINSVVSVNQAAGFSIVNYTGNATNSSIGHGLSVLPEMVFYKDLSAANNWTVYAEPITVSKYLKLNANTAETTDSYNIFNGNPTTSLLNIGSGNSINTNSNNYIAYCFTSISGYSKVGSYTGTGVAGQAGSLVVTGFQPQFVVVKRIDAANSWVVSSTLLGYNDLYFNSSDTEFASGSLYGAHYTSTGFYFNTADQSRNISGGQYIYLAIA